MAFVDALRGVNATRETSFLQSDGSEVRCAVRMLHPDLEIPGIIAEAKRRAIAGGSSGAETDPAFDRWCCVLTCARAVVDPDTYPPQPFFDGGPAQVLQRLDRAQIHRLTAAQMEWQAECSAFDHKLSASELLGAKPDGPVNHFVVSAGHTRSAGQFFGQADLWLTHDQVWAWLSLANEHAERIEKKKAG